MRMEYRKGEKHTNADAMLRNTCELCVQCQTMHDDAKKGKVKTRILILTEDLEEFIWQTNDEEIKQIKKKVK